tara:strand:- start:1207 stop:2286 length:1080 start_codon:yes stop_codon:yes gene_type:complete
MQSNFEQNLLKIESDTKSSITSLDHESALEDLRISVLGRRGSLTLLLRSISDLPGNERQSAGSSANILKSELATMFDEKLKEIISLSQADSNLGETFFDVSLPGRTISSGSLHPTTQIVRDICEAFSTMGFQVLEGPEVELDEYNFQKLNIPDHHPARDMWNSLWIEGDSTESISRLLLRTHTSPMQIRVMESTQPPIRVLVPGKAYRYEATDATHEWQFCQIEGLAIDKNITFANLKATLEAFARQIFGSRRKSRFRCDFFPFVEPGAEMSIDCFKCDGAGCRVCGNTGWIEIMGAGMVHPEVLKGVGYDPDVYSGFAFGMGAERISMLKHGIDDIRHFYSNDIRFLDQFSSSTTGRS